MPDSYPKKLIEVSIPLQEINEASAREKSIRHGHPSTLHLWWARRPLSAARAVLFCQLVDDPSGYADELITDKQKKEIAKSDLLKEPEGKVDLAPRLMERLVEKERERLHQIVKDLVIWENTTNETVLNRARKEIVKSWKRTCRREGKPEDTPMPPVLDPFAGGGAIPLEAQRLGMEAHASDLNPVAVLINKAMIEIPPKFAGLPPVNPEWQAKTIEEKAATTWKGAQGLAEDVRYYGEWMRAEAEKRIGHLYPKYEITQEILDEREDLVAGGYQAGDELTVIAWLWARTVPSPNPALNGKHVPLVSSYWLSKKKGKEVYVEPVIEDGDYRFEVRVGKPTHTEAVDAGTKSGRGAFYCLISGTPFQTNYVQECGGNSELSANLFAVVCEGKRGRVYLNSNRDQISKSKEAVPTWAPGGDIPRNLTGGTCVPYGLDTFGKLFTNRQLVALTTFSDLVGEAREKVMEDAMAAHLAGCEASNITPEIDAASYEKSGEGPQAYADALSLYLGLAMSRLSDRSSTICGWDTGYTKIRNTFGRQAIPMSWDYAEANVLSTSTGNFSGMVSWVRKALENFPANAASVVQQANASTRDIPKGTIISSDPPYYDNISYADLSDYFYVWLRRTLRKALPNATSSILVPKEDELIAAPYRQGGRKEADSFFLNGMRSVAAIWARETTDAFPTTIYYAFKQAEIKKDGIASTGWATFLGALMDAGFGIVGTWPVRTEMVNKIGQKANMLASSIVLVCRKRPSDAPKTTRRELIDLLESELPDAISELLNGNIAPVDLPQSAIGPGMAIFSRFSGIINPDGSEMQVTEALQLVNRQLSEILTPEIGEVDAWTGFAVQWFQSFGFEEGPFGDADNVARPFDISVAGAVNVGIAQSGSGKVRIFRPAELPPEWDPATDDNLTIWEIVHHLIRLMDVSGDESCACVLAAVSGSDASAARQLAYGLYTIANNNGWSAEAQSYDQLVRSWSDFAELASNLETKGDTVTQDEMFS